MSKQEDRHINDLTLRYFSNKDYANQFKKERENRGDIDATTQTMRKRRREYKFYQKRVVDLTRRLLLYKPGSDEKECDALPLRVHDAFSCFANNCVDYFQSLDKSDLLQSELVSTNQEPEDALFSKEWASSHTEDFDYKSVNADFVKTLTAAPKQNTLTKFVLRKESAVDTAPTNIPQRRDVNLKDPALRIKGVGKKKNVESTYEDIHETKIRPNTHQEPVRGRDKDQVQAQNGKKKNAKNKGSRKDKKDAKDAST